MKKVIPFLLLSLLWSFKNDTSKETTVPLCPISQENIKEKQDHQIREIQKAVIVPTIDGDSNDPIWKQTTWYAIDQRWSGESYTFQDFFGRYKMAWTPETLYLLVEIKDDVLKDTHKDPLTSWIHDDGVVLFIDVDNSGGAHQYSNNAFGYHIALDGHVVDLNTKQSPVLHDHHITSKQKVFKDILTWEFAITLYDDTYIDGKPNDAIFCAPDQKLGFAIGYMDTDHSTVQENYIGSVFIPGTEKTIQLDNANTFGTIVLKE